MSDKSTPGEPKAGQSILQGAREARDYARGERDGEFVAHVHGAKQRPQAGDVWRHKDGSVREVGRVLSATIGGDVEWREPAYCGTWFLSDPEAWADWSRHATRVASHEDPGDVA